MKTNGRRKADRTTPNRARVAGLPVGGSDLEDLVRAAWLYYMAGHTQELTAEFLGVSRVKAARLLAEAREAGIVKISIEHHLSATAEMEEHLRRRFNLTFCRVTPPLLAWTADPKKALGKDTVRSARNTAVENALARRAVGMTAARYLRERLQASERPLLGFAWGRTTTAMVEQLAGVRKPDATFVSIMGSLTLSSAANIFEVVHRLAEKTGGAGHFLPVPYIANSVADRDILMSQRVVQEALALAARASLHFISLGECDGDGFLFEGGHLSTQDLAGLHAAGAVGDAMGKFFDQNGRPVDSELNQRTLALDTHHFSGREVVALCAGCSKDRAIRGLLRTGFVTGLVIDGDTARKVCEQEGDLVSGATV